MEVSLETGKLYWVRKLFDFANSYGFGLEIDSAIFLDLQRFGKDNLFRMAMKKFSIFVRENSLKYLKWA